MKKKIVLDVGQCNADHSRISQMLHQNFNVAILRAESLDEAQQLAESNAVDLILVNRLMDADGSEGMEVIHSMKNNDATKSAPVMLVSNYRDAQNKAVAAGALPGFGKDSLTIDSTIQMLDKVLGS